MELLGRVLLEAGKKFSLKWLPGEKKPLDQGDVLVLRFRESEVLRLTIGSLKDLASPETMEWLSKTIGPSDDEPIVCKIYKQKGSVI